jgi:hypothetical protein
LDECSQNLLNNNNNNLVPIQTGADGNCFYRAVSFSLYGTEAYFHEIRFRVALEFILNYQNYLKNDYLESMVVNYTKENQTQTLLQMCINLSRSDNEMDEEIFFDQVISACKLGAWSGIFHFFAASNALGLNINPIYPAYNRCSSYLNFKITPADKNISNIF